jgi:predicted peroxiredoxin
VLLGTAAASLAASDQREVNMFTFRFAVCAFLAVSLLFANPGAHAKPSLNASDAASGIKETMSQGVKAAILQLGRPDGFLNDQAVKILLPKNLQKLADTARKLGASKYVDELEISMNRAAEKAIPAAADIFADAAKQMTVTDAINIVRGSDDAGTQFFKRVTATSLQAKFLPIVSSATADSGVAKRYKALNKKVGGLGQILGGGSAAPDLDTYITEKAMDGLYYYIAEKERAIRKNPLQQGSDLLRRVFKR